jgi:hypothetical protein
MREALERLLLMSEPDVLPLRAQAERSTARAPERSQFAHLLRHFLERFFNHETASPDGDAKTRLVLAAFAAGLPSFVIALYLWPEYHSFMLVRRGHHLIGVHGPPPYWVQVNQHFFFVVYSFVAMGIVTVFEWEMFFPDLLDIFILKPLPVPELRTFLARVAAIAILLGAFLFDANILATFVLPSAIEPPDLPRFLAGHLLAVTGSGLFSALFVLAFQCVVLALLGERWFRRLSLLMQGLSIAGLLMLLLLFPVFSTVVPSLLLSGGWMARCFPPFWFLGIYERLMEGPSALPIYIHLARTGCMVTLLAAAIVIVTYPIAYLRRTRQLIEGGIVRPHRSWPGSLIERVVNATIVRTPRCRAIFHFVTQTLFRVPRYRIYLVLYGGVGLSIVIAGVLRFAVVTGHVEMLISADGLRASIGIVVFWALAGLRLAFLSPGNQRGSWIFAFVDGRPPAMATALQQLRAVKLWAVACVGCLTCVACAIAAAIAPPRLLTARAVTAEGVVAAGLCVVLADLFFLPVTTVAFTGEAKSEPPNPALAVAKYFTFFPIVVWFAVYSGPWMAQSLWRLLAAGLVVVAAHKLIEMRHRAIVREYCEMFRLDEEGNPFLLRLDLWKYDAVAQPSEEDTPAVLL